MYVIFAGAALCTTIGLVSFSPRVLTQVRYPLTLAAGVGVAILAAAGLVHPEDTVRTVTILWQPILTLLSIMILATLARSTGLLSWLAEQVEWRAGRSANQLFVGLFVLSALTASVFNNDSAILLLTPLVLMIVHRLFPHRADLLTVFGFAIFMAAGVAPFMTSNPMNTIVTSYAGIGFNQYAATMAPIAIAGWIVSFAILRLIFRQSLANSFSERKEERTSIPLNAAAIGLIMVMAVTLISFSLLSYFHLPLWPMATAGAAIALKIASLKKVSLGRRFWSEIPWDIFGFFLGVFLLGLGLQSAGLVGYLSSLYQPMTLPGIGIVSAFCSALANNHPMTILNALAVKEIPGDCSRRILAVLIGGDLGPRLLPMGSLAGLLWLDQMRRFGVDISLRLFVLVGIMVTVPTLVLSLLILTIF